ncbi:cupin domain-containing protein [Croceibacterium aestuarii]|uniref:cupin domain-containing protein n=1 Tax=Croceibacterium aestuarii TaxID=3064139 RepID=UPI00272DE761|nr:cupin domain-containing protein [Croceibacterium sp. D39]
MPEEINLAGKFALIDEHWSPRLAARYNGNEVRPAKASGDFHWHSHPDTDELFLVVEGHLEIDFRERTARLAPGDMIVVPRGTEHRPRVPQGEVSMLVIDAEGTPNTGDPGTAKVVTAI